MKKIPKKKLHKLMEMTKEFWSHGMDEEEAQELLRERIGQAQAFEQETGIDWFAILCLLDGIFHNAGLCPDADNFKIYAVLGLLGWEVADGEIQESEGL